MRASQSYFSLVALRKECLQFLQRQEVLAWVDEPGQYKKPVHKPPRGLLSYGLRAQIGTNPPKQ